MELRQLRYFVAVAEDGNISRAAQRIFLTQPALSRQIKALEEEIGRCLFERQAHSIRLTAAGQALLGEARELLAHADQMLERIRHSGQVRLRIGYAPSLASGFLSLAVERFTQTHADARVDLLDLSTQEMLTGLESLQLDAIVTVAPPRSQRGLVWTPLIQTGWQVAVHSQHALAKRPVLKPADFGDAAILGYCRKDYPEYLELLTAWFRQHHQRLRMVGEYDGVESLLAAVAAGLGLALVTPRAAHRVPARVVLKKIQDAPPPLCVAAARRADDANHQPLGVFIEELRRAAAASGDRAQGTTKR